MNQQRQSPTGWSGVVGKMVVAAVVTTVCIGSLGVGMASSATPHRAFAHHHAHAHRARSHHSATSASFRRTNEYHRTIAVTRIGSSLADSQSSNWSGYNKGILDTTTVTSSISAQWVVPTATQHVAGEAEASATWIGVGGGCLQSSCTVTDNTLIQAGTEQDVSATGQASYNAWYEIIPVPELASTIAVHAGDVITCSISQVVPGVWTIVLNDTTDGQGFTQTVPYPSDGSTAEWIEETPTEIGSSGANLAALPNLTTVNFTAATVNGANAALVPADALQLIDANGNPIATPSDPVTGNEFNDCAWALACPAP